MGKSYLQGEVLTAADLNASLAEAVNTTGYFVFTGERVHQALLTANSGFIVNTSPSYFYSTSNFYSTITVSSGNIILSTGNLTATQGNITASQGNITASQGNITASSGILSDQIGNVRKIPINSVGNGYTATINDLGKLISLSGSVNVPGGTFTAGDNINILNNTASTQSVFPTSGLTLRQAGSTSTGNRTLDPYGVCTVIFLNASTAVITGTGVN